MKKELREQLKSQLKAGRQTKELREQLKSQLKAGRQT
eukprot:gene34261-42249_t